MTLEKMCDTRNKLIFSILHVITVEGVDVVGNTSVLKNIRRNYVNAVYFSDDSRFAW